MESGLLQGVGEELLGVEVGDSSQMDLHIWSCDLFSVVEASAPDEGGVREDRGDPGLSDAAGCGLGISAAVVAPVQEPVQVPSSCLRAWRGVNGEES